jgi:hypothetical protein
VRDVQNIADILVDSVITTDRRSYHLELANTPATAMAAVSWTYPADALIALKREAAAAEAAKPVAAGVPLERLHFVAGARTASGGRSGAIWTRESRSCRSRGSAPEVPGCRLGHQKTHDLRVIFELLVSGPKAFGDLPQTL